MIEKGRLGNLERGRDKVNNSQKMDLKEIRKARVDHMLARAGEDFDQACRRLEKLVDCMDARKAGFHRLMAEQEFASGMRWMELARQAIEICRM
jgi:uncharacterized protein with von Willebrand factor type A (vWA) domain